jgi:hypothetical protein
VHQLHPLPHATLAADIAILGKKGAWQNIHCERDSRATSRARPKGFDLLVDERDLPVLLPLALPDDEEPVLEIDILEREGR